MPSLDGFRITTSKHRASHAGACQKAWWNLDESVLAPREVSFYSPRKVISADKASYGDFSGAAFRRNLILLVFSDLVRGEKEPEGREEREREMAQIRGTYERSRD